MAEPGALRLTQLHMPTGVYTLLVLFSSEIGFGYFQPAELLQTPLGGQHGSSTPAALPRP